MSNADVTLSGNITSDPELKFTTGEVARLSFGIACNKSWKNSQNEWEEETSFFNVTVWRNLAEQAASVLEKGMPIVVNGELKQDRWEDSDGNNRSTVNVTAKSIAINVWGVESIQRRQGKGNGGNSSGGQRQQRAPQGDPFESSNDPFDAFA